MQSEGKTDCRSSERVSLWHRKRIQQSKLDRVHFTLPVEEKLEAAAKIGYGGVIKVLLGFKDEWRIDARGKDLSKMMFVFSKEKIPTWWTQYPRRRALLIGWIGGPKAERFADASSEDIIHMGLASLENIFEVATETLQKKLTAWRVINWPADPLARGAYSYPTPETAAAFADTAKAGEE